MIANPTPAQPHVPTDNSFGTLTLSAEPLRPLPPGRRPEEACHRVLRNCNQHGDCIKRRDWCLLRGSAQALLTLRGRREERRPAYLFGRSEGNPTHVTCLHMLPLLRWMELADVPLGQVGAAFVSAGPRRCGAISGSLVRLMLGRSAAHEVVREIAGAASTLGSS